MQSVREQLEPLLLRIPEAADMLGCGRSTVYKLIARGELRPVHIGRAVRLPTDELREYVERQRAVEAVPLNARNLDQWNAPISRP